MQNYDIDNYKQFRKGNAIFENGHSCYFKMNLYPIAFKNTDPVFGQMKS